MYPAEDERGFNPATWPIRAGAARNLLSSRLGAAISRP